MAIASYVGSQLDRDTNTFQDWLTRTNSIVNDMGSVVISVGDNNTGNVELDGTFSSNTLVVVDDIRGGTVDAAANIAFSSNADFNYTANFNEHVNFNGNTVTVNSASFSIDTETSVNNPLTVVSSNATIDSNSSLIVLGLSDLGGNTVISNELTISATTEVTSDNVTFTGNNVTFGNNTSVLIEGDFTYNRAITFTDVDILNDLTVTGNVSANVITANDFNSLSDINLKENVNTLTHSIDIVNSLNPVSFVWKDSQKKAYGLIAQEVQEILPDIVSKDDRGNLTVAYTQIISMLIQTVQQQQKDIDELKSCL